MFAALIVVVVGTLFGPMLGSRLDLVTDGIDAWESAVKKVVADKKKRRETLAFVDTVRKEVVVRRRNFADSMTQYLKVDARYDASAEDYEAALIQLNTTWTEQETWLLDRRFALKEMMTQAEWTAAVAQVDAALNEQWDTLKEAQKKLSNNLKKREKRAARHH